jgi:thymidylate kinase
MIVILEGPDGAGKTTLAKRLEHELSKTGRVFVNHHGPYPNLDSGALARAYFVSMLPALTHDNHVILDRSWISEPIYAKAYRNVESRITVAQRRMLERAALSRNAVVVNCCAPYGACKKVFGERPEYIDSGSLRRVCDEYEDWADFKASREGLSIIDYDYTSDDLDTLIDDVLREKDHKNPLRGGGSYTTCNTLVLSSKWRAPGIQPKAIVIPFMSLSDRPGPPSASTRLTLDFEDQNIREDQMYWVNLETDGGGQLTAEQVEDIGAARIVAVGPQAKIWCQANGIEATFINAPRSK